MALNTSIDNTSTSHYSLQTCRFRWRCCPPWPTASEPRAAPWTQRNQPILQMTATFSVTPLLWGISKSSAVTSHSSLFSATTELPSSVPDFSSPLLIPASSTKQQPGFSSSNTVSSTVLCNLLLVKAVPFLSSIKRKMPAGVTS